MKTVVIYKSKTGFVKKYAEWISDELSADIFEASNVTMNMLRTYDTVIYGGGLYSVGINGVHYITQNIEKIKDKKVIIFATGMSPFRKETIDEIIDKNFTLNEQKQIRFFYLRGGFDFNRLKVSDKILMTLLKCKIKLKKNKGLTSDEEGMLASYKKPVDLTRKKNIDEIITYVNS